MNSKIKAHKTYNYPDTLFYSNNIVSGVVTTPKSDATLNDNIYMLKNMFNSECGLVHFTGSIHCKDTIYKETLSWGRNGIIEDTIESLVPLYPTNDNIDLDFRLRFEESGEYKLYFTFYTTTSNMYSRVVEVSIIDDFRNAINSYKVVPLPLEELKLNGEEIYNILNINGLVFQLSNRPSKRYSQHSQFIGAGVGLTHTLIVPIEPSDAIYNLVIGEKRIPLIESNLELFEELVLDNYWVYVTDRYTEWEYKEGFNELKVLICIKKDFTKDDLLRVEPTSYVESLDPITKSKKLRATDEFRFYPIFHKLEEFDNSQPIGPDDTIYITPSMHHSKPIGSCHWEFKNASTLKSTYSTLTELHDYPDGRYMGDHGQSKNGGTQSVLFAPFNSTELDSGYYDIILHYKEGETEQQIELKSAFIYDTHNKHHD